ncbi:MAG TPA: hypothetical protein VFZ75_00150 [Actinomycetota bacterium]|nr:hypothetical protein [Actinomycetota bacterium]
MRRRAVVGRMTAAFLAAIVTVGVVTLVAGAHDTDFMDPNDRAGKLDVRIVKLKHAPSPAIWTVVTFGDWGIREIWDRGYVTVMLDTRDGPPADHYLLVRSTGNELRGSLWRIRAVGPDIFQGAVQVHRRSRRSVSVQVSLWRLAFGESRRFYRWSVHTIFTSDACRRTCQDHAPNGGVSVKQWRPGMSPSPSPSASPSPPG